MNLTWMRQESEVELAAGFDADVLVEALEGSVGKTPPCNLRALSKRSCSIWALIAANLF